MIVDYSDEEENKNEYKVPITPDVDYSHIIKVREEKRALELSKTYNFEEPKKNHLTGNVESFNMNDYAFEE